MDAAISLWGLFLSSFISSTVFPGGSEVVLVLLANNPQHDPWLLLGIASLGNTLGGLSTWLLGYLLARRFPIEQHLSPDRQRAVTRLRAWGSPALLLSWLPVVGDTLCFAAGYLRMPFLLSLFFLALGKTVRYAILIIAFA